MSCLVHIKLTHVIMYADMQHFHTCFKLSVLLISVYIQLVSGCTNGTIQLAGEDLLMKAEWSSASMECGGQCVMIAGITMMPELCADS